MDLVKLQPAFDEVIEKAIDLLKKERMTYYDEYLVKSLLSCISTLAIQKPVTCNIYINKIRLSWPQDYDSDFINYDIIKAVFHNCIWVDQEWEQNVAICTIELF